MQVFNDFDADVIVLDVQNAGISIYDQLGAVTKDTERNIEYPAMTIMRHISIEDDVYKELSARTLGIDAMPIIYPISASARSNSAIAVEMRDKLQKKMVGFLIEESKAEDYLIKAWPGEYLRNDDPSAKAFFLSPYVQTSLLTNECINLAMSMVAGNIKLTETPGSRKDRYSALSYGNHYACLLDTELLKDNEGQSDEEAILAVTMVM